MQMLALNCRIDALPRPNRWETLCALQGMLPQLRRNAARLGHAELAYWLERAEIEARNIVKGRQGDVGALPGLIAASPRKLTAAAPLKGETTP